MRDDPPFLGYISDWFDTREWVCICYNGSEYCDDDDDYDDDDDDFFKWYDGYKKRKAQKASIKEDLMPIAWHPSRWWDWCVPEDEKGSVENLWA